jgi:decaprenyl-phosphate phosphoribosyltransferase
MALQNPSKRTSQQLSNRLQAAAPYIKIARFDHWFKNIFMIPGVVVALYARPELISVATLWGVVLALFSTGLVASSNYVLNELLDAPFDALHPVKKARPVPSGQVNKRIAVGLWLVLACIGLSLAAVLGRSFFLGALLLWVMGCLYNTPPARTKDVAYLDVLSESVNNPIRFILGWYCTGVLVLPPISILLAYWMIGAFFMAIKRLAEYRMIDDPQVSGSYRRSFTYYTEERLLISIVYYATGFGLFFGIFLIRYRLELICAAPFIAGFMAWYIQMGFLTDSPAQYPEKLYRQRGFVLYCLLCTGILFVLLFVPLPWLHELFQPSFTT